MCSSSSNTTQIISLIDETEDSVSILKEKLYPKTLKTKLGELILNVHKNHERPEGTGFIINKVVCQGAINRLADCFYSSNFKHPKKRRGKTMSSRSWGIKFHRQVYHRYKCFSNTGSCMCSQKFKTKSKTRAVREGTMMHRQLQSFEKFLKDTGWIVFDCELVVGWNDINCATSLDVVCVDDIFHPKNFYVIELKTGYVQRYQPRTTDSSGKMRGPCGKEIVNSYANHHQLQLWFGVEALKRTYNIDTTQAVVLYIKEGKKYKADYAASWWFHDSKMKRKMQDQLCGNTATFRLC